MSMGFGDALVYVKQPVDEVRLSSMRWRGTRCAVLLGATLAIGTTGGGQTPTAPLARENAYRANNLGVALLEQFKFEDAAAAFREALKLRTGSRHRTLQSGHRAAARRRPRRRENGGGRRRTASCHGAAAALLLASSPAKKTATRTPLDSSDAFARSIHATPVPPSTSRKSHSEPPLPRGHRAAQAAFADEPYSMTAAYNLGMALTRAGQRDEGSSS